VLSRYASALPLLAAMSVIGSASEPGAVDSFRKSVAPVLDAYCVRCHDADTKKGSVVFDTSPAGEAKLIDDDELWHKTLKVLRAGMMPPKGREKPTAGEIKAVESWVKYTAFEIDPKNPDPGHVTLRRLNRTEYRNTIRDLTGVDFNAPAEFPADDTGHGFDTIGEVLTLSPLLLEKYIAASKQIISQAVPTQPFVPAEVRIPGRKFQGAGAMPGPPESPLPLPYVKAATATATHKVAVAGPYKVILDLTANEQYVEGQFDYNKCRLTFKDGDKTLATQEFVRQGGKSYRFEADVDWPVGERTFTISLEPLTPKEKQVRNLQLRVGGVTVRGPLIEKQYVRPAGYEKWFPGMPTDAKAREEYARELLTKFATKAFRRPVDVATVSRLVGLARDTAATPGQTFEAGIARAMTVVLASPRFLFREERTVPVSGEKYHLIDEFALASRLSYFLWSTTPDDELLKLATAGTLRANLPKQLDRMLADPKSGEFTKNFVGQWLMTRGVDGVNINAQAVISKDEVRDPKADEQRNRFRELVRKPPESLTPAEKKELEQARANFGAGFRRFAQFELNGDLRRAMKSETEMGFDFVLKNDRSLLELIDADYTFLNEKLAKHYGIEGVTGDRMRKVDLPKDSVRGGVITQGTVLTVTSNPDRTSPVKRGLFLLENLIGAPPPPAPPDITPLEDAAAGVKGGVPTLREVLKVHRADALCSSCHNRMDPLGLALEPFNALGRFREKERGQPIETAGELITGETFQNVRELKKVLATERRFDFYRCVTEKLLIYALGRGLEHADVQLVDEIVEKLEATQGKPSALLAGVVNSAAFQRTRATTPPAKATTESPDPNERTDD
jgi:hypothetical protein